MWLKHEQIQQERGWCFLSEWCCSGGPTAVDHVQRAGEWGCNWVCDNFSEKPGFTTRKVRFKFFSLVSSHICTQIHHLKGLKKNPSLAHFHFYCKLNNVIVKNGSYIWLSFWSVLIINPDHWFTKSQMAKESRKHNWANAATLLCMSRWN